jgi:hypothetical protein
MATRTKISDEAKERLGPAAAKAAQKAPAGDTELSGAAPGIKAEEQGPDEVTPFEKPKATERAERASDKRADEVREIQLDVHRRQVTSVPSENVRTVYSTPQDGKDPESITFQQVGNTVVVTATAKEMEFSREDFLGFVRHTSQIGPTL